MRAEQERRHEPPRYDRRCLARQGEVAAERAAGMRAVLRLRMPEGVTVWDDVIRGRVQFSNAEIDDQVLLKSDGFPTYHLAVVVDDHLMEMTHVIRSDEWIPSTPKHLAIYAALGWEPPLFCHVPQVLGEDRQKLSKRRGARTVMEYAEAGYVPEALINAMALLGWSSGTGQELFTRDELIAAFSLDRIQSSPALFDSHRLDSLNGLHLRRMPTEELVEALEFHLPETSKEVRRRLVPLLRERMVTLRDAVELAAPLLGAAPWDPDVVFPPAKVDRETAAQLIDDTIAEVSREGWTTWRGCGFASPSAWPPGKSRPGTGFGCCTSPSWAARRGSRCSTPWPSSARRRASSAWRPPGASSTSAPVSGSAAAGWGRCARRSSAAGPGPRAPSPCGSRPSRDARRRPAGSSRPAAPWPRGG